MVVMEETSSARLSVRVVIVYRHALLRDVAVHVLGRAGIDVVAVIHADDFDAGALRDLRPHTIIVDQAAIDDLDHFGASILLSQEPDYATRIVTIGLLDTTMVVCDRWLVADATPDSLVDAVAGANPPSLGPEPNADRPHLRRVL